MLTAPYTMFGVTKELPIQVVYQNKPVENPESWDEELWVERPEDYYALQSPQLVNKRVRVVRREDWIWAGL